MVQRYERLVRSGSEAALRHKVVTSLSLRHSEMRSSGVHCCPVSWADLSLRAWVVRLNGTETALGHSWPIEAAATSSPTTLHGELYQAQLRTRQNHWMKFMFGSRYALAADAIDWLRIGFRVANRGRFRGLLESALGLSSCKGRDAAFGAPTAQGSPHPGSMKRCAPVWTRLLTSLCCSA